MSVFSKGKQLSLNTCYSVLAVLYEFVKCHHDVMSSVHSYCLGLFAAFVGM